MKEKKRRNSKPVVKKKLHRIKVLNQNLHKLINCFGFIIIRWYINKSLYSLYIIRHNLSPHINDF